MKKAIITVVMVLTFVGLSKNASAQYIKLLDFDSTNGRSPYGSLISDGTFLYGMTQNGGRSDDGLVFKIKPDGSGYDTLFNFTGSINNGEFPNDGSLYYDGIFLYGMANNIFKIMPNGTGYTNLLNYFGGVPDGGGPNGSLISDGTFLYGATGSGGIGTHCGLSSPYGCGTIFKIKPDGSGYIKLHDFDSINGTYPNGSLIYDGTFLYGMTQNGGTNAQGTIFKIKPDGTGDSVLLNFLSTTTGSTPGGSLFYDGTFLYGMTPYGGTSGNGNIFKIKPDGSGYINLYSFANTPDGCSPWGSLISDGTFLYGTTGGCGTTNFGTIFKIKPNGTGYAKLYDFSPATGRSNDNLILNGGCLYGMTEAGGTSNNCPYGCGTVFKYCLIGVGIEQFANSNEQVTIYPNPASTTINLTISQFDNGKTNSVEVYNTIGECVHRQIIKSSNCQIDVYSLAEGIYNISIINSERVVNKRVVIVR